MINLQWGTQRNGQIDTILLVDVSGRGDYLEPTAAAQFKRMQAAIWRDIKFNLQPAAGSSANRPLATQIEFFTARYTKVSYNTGLWWNGSYWTKKAGVSVAAIPGTSNHGWARAIDLNISQLDRQAWAWMLAHAGEYGYSWATGKASGEDWHWECLTPPGTAVAGSSATPIPTGDEFDMASLDDLKNIVNAAVAPLTDDETRELDATRREGRLWRLFRNADRVGKPDEFVAVAYGLPVGDPRQVIYVDRQTAIAMNGTYQMTADTPENAKALPAENIATTVRMANGTDRIYAQKPAS